MSYEDWKELISDLRRAKPAAFLFLLVVIVLIFFSGSKGNNQTLNVEANRDVNAPLINGNDVQVINNSGAFASGNGASAVQNNYGSFAEILRYGAQSLNVATSTGYEQTYELEIADLSKRTVIHIDAKGVKVEKQKFVEMNSFLGPNGMYYIVRISFITSKPIKGEETTFKVVQ